MRQIKFRGWHTALNKMFSPEEMGNDQLTIMPNGKGFINVNSVSTNLSQFITQLIPLQFTGLTDNNGIEIYEGDVVRCFSSKEELAFMNGSHPIIFHDGMFCLSYQTTELTHFLREYDIEVIGNIHQTPCLLT